MRLHLQERSGQLRGRLLHIEQPRRMQRMLAGTKPIGDEQSLGDDAAGLERLAKQCRQRLPIGFERIHAQGAPRRTLHRREIGGKIVAELRFHAVDKGCG